MTDLQRTARVAEIQSCLRNQPRLKLEFLATMSRLFREHNIDLPHEVLASLTITLERAKGGRGNADEKKIKDIARVAHLPSMAPSPHAVGNAAAFDLPAMAPVPHENAAADLPTPTPIHTANDLPTPTPIHTADDVADLPTPTPIHTAGDVADLPTPTPIHTRDDVADLPTPTPIHIRDESNDLKRFVKKIFPKGK